MAFLRTYADCRNFIEAPEPYQREQRHHVAAVDLLVILRGLDGDCCSCPVHGRGEEEHVQIVVGINGETFALGGFLIGVPRLDIRTHSVPPPAELIVGVGRHVVEMAGARNEVTQTVGTGFGELRLGGCFGQMDVEMTGAYVAQVSGQNAFEDGLNSLDVG